MIPDPQRVQDLFLAAIDRPPGDWPAFLDAECGPDGALRDRVAVLLAAHEWPSGGGPPETRTAAPGDPDETLAGPAGSGSAGEGAGDLLAGRYLLGEVLGEGGMGVVRRAEQVEPVRREVAVKLVKAGMDSRSVLARFDTERQALAVMDHPNIAKVLDGGATALGRPFFVMELVRGVSVTQYCDARRLGVRARLDLFATVCLAVEHAHQKGVIHRDLKPGNVLVAEADGRPVPKVIDFGLAKALFAGALDDLATETAAGGVLGTPLYMAPEQAGRGLGGADTRADVYALGVILYELLTGTTPIEREAARQSDFGEVLRQIREVEPPTPSRRLSGGGDPARRAREVRGELDWVTMRCLEKDPARRYPTASALAADVRRYLADEPVSAGPPSRTYKARKFARRNRVTVATTFVLLAALAAGVVGTTLGLAWAVAAERAALLGREETRIALDRVMVEQAKTRAALATETEVKRLSQRALESLTDPVVGASLDKQEAPSEADAKYLDRVLQCYADFARADGDSPAARRFHAQGSLRVAALQQRLGRLPAAEESARQAARLADGLPDDDAEALDLRAAARLSLGNLLTAQGRRDGGLTELLAAARLREGRAAANPADRDNRRKLADTYAALATHARTAKAGPQSEEEGWHRRADAECDRLLADPEADALDRERKTSTAIGLADCRAYASDYPAAERAYRAAEVALRAFIAEQPDHAKHLFSLYRLQNNLGSLYKQTGNTPAWLETHRQAAATADELAGRYPAVPAYQSAVAHVRHNLAKALPAADPARLDEFRKAALVSERVALAYPESAAYQEVAYGHLLGYANALKSGNPQEALATLGKLSALAAKWPAPREPAAALALGSGFTTLAASLAELKDFRAADREFANALRLLSAPGAPDAEVAKRVARVYDCWANAAAAEGLPPAAATAHLRAAVAASEKAPAGDPARWPGLHQALSRLAAHLTAAKLPDEATAVAQRDEELLAAQKPSAEVAAAWNQAGERWAALNSAPRASACFDSGRDLRFAVAEADAPPADFRELSDADLDALTRWVAALPPGWRPTAINAHAKADPPRFHAVARGGFPAVKVEATVTQASRLPQPFLQARLAAGWTPAGVSCTFAQNAQATRLDLWATPQAFWTGYSHLTGEDFAPAKKAAGLRPSNLQCQTKSDAPGSEVGVWYVEDRRDWWVFRGQSAADLARTAAAMKGKGWRPAAADSVGGGDQLRFASVFMENPGGDRWEFAPGLPPADYAAASDAWRAAGLRPLVVMAHGPPDAPRVTAFWVAADAERRESLRAARASTLRVYGEKVRDLDLNRALAAFREGVALNPKSADARLALAGALGESGLWGELVENYRLAGVKPGDPHAPNLALGLHMTGKSEEAARLAGGDYGGYQSVLLLADAGRPEEAAAELAALVRRDRGTAAGYPAEHYNRVGWVVPCDEWDPADAVRLGRLAVAACKLPWTRYALACALLRAGKPAQAEAELREAIKIDPSWAPGTVKLVQAIAARELGRVEDARRLYEEGCRHPERFWLGKEYTCYHFCEYRLVKREADRVMAADYDPAAALDRQIDATRHRLAEAARGPASPGPGKTGGRVTSVRGGGWSLRDGVLSCDAGMRNEACAVGFGDPMWGDIDFAVELRTTGPAGEGAAVGVGTRAPDSAKLVTLTLGVGGNATHQAQSWRPQAVTLARTPGALESGRWYAVRVELRGRKFRYFLDGKLLFEVEDGTSPRGVVQLDATRVGVEFRAIRVTDPAGNALWDGPPRLGPPEAVRVRGEEVTLRRSLEVLEARRAGRPLPAPPPPPPVTDFREVHGADAAALRQWLRDLPDGFRPVALTTHADAMTPARFDAVAVADGRPVEWLAHLALAQEVGDAPDADAVGMAASGWQLALSAAYSDRGRSRRHHVWAMRGDGTSACRFGGQPGRVAAEVKQARDRRHRPTGLSGGELPDLICGPDEGRSWEFHHGLTAAQLAAKVNTARGRGWRPDVLHAAGPPDKPSFAVVLVSCRPGEAWDFRQDLTEAEYARSVADGRAGGRWPAAVASHGVGDGVRYAAVSLSSPGLTPRELAPPPRAAGQRVGP